MRRNGPVQRPVVLAWKQQQNISDTRKNAAAWPDRLKLSSIAGSWRKWRRPGRSSPKRRSRRALTRRADQFSAWRRVAEPRAARPAPPAKRLMRIIPRCSSTAALRRCSCDVTAIQDSKWWGRGALCARGEPRNDHRWHVGDRPCCRPPRYSRRVIRSILALSRCPVCPQQRPEWRTFENGRTVP